ncbi:MAG: hypothetical protein JNL72_07110 [Flavipsychrobacter sp.]|nr:hypothetical protein [Flavipsychrobacter sp.]
MKQLLTLLFIAVTLTSCSKQHTCVCELTITEYGITKPNGSVDTMLYGKKEEVLGQCKAKAIQYTSSSRYSYYTTFYDAICDIK